MPTDRIRKKKQDVKVGIDGFKAIVSGRW